MNRDELVKVVDLIAKMFTDEEFLSVYRDDYLIHLQNIIDIIEQNNRNAVLDEAIEAVKFKYRNSEIFTTESMYPAIEAIESKKT